MPRSRLGPASDAGPADGGRIREDGTTDEVLGIDDRCAGVVVLTMQHPDERDALNAELRLPRPIVLPNAT